MKIRNIEPHRKDLLIDTEWGIPKQDLSNEGAKSQGLKLYKKYWVTKDEKEKRHAIQR